MNALYDAPVDDEGKPLFADVPVRERVLMRADEKALVQYACDGERFAVSVRDAFGTLRKETVLQYLDKCLHAERRRADRSQGGRRRPRALPDRQLGLRGRLPHLRRLGDRGDLQLRPLGASRRSCARSASTRSASSTRRAPAGEITHDPDAPRPPPRRSGAAPPPPRAGALLPVMMTFAVLLLALRRRPGRAALPAPPRRRVAAHRDRSAGRARLRRRARRGTAPLAVDGRGRPQLRRARGPRPATATTSSWSPPPPATRRCACTSTALAGRARRRDRAARRARPRRRQGDRQADAGRRSSSTPGRRRSR